MFSTLRKGSSIYILDRTGTPEVKLGYIENVSIPRPMYPTFNPSVSLGTNMQTVVDLTVRIDNENKEFCVPSNLSIHTYGDYTLSETKEAMISEVDSLYQNNKDVVDSVPKRQSDMSAYKDILKKLNPVYAKEEERDTRITELSERMDNIQSYLEKIEDLLKRQ